MPVTVISAIGSASKLGVVIKSGVAFEQLGTIRTVALDKTGTLTRNQPQVVAVHTAPGYTRGDVLDIAAALEAASSHPLANAVIAAATTRLRADGAQEQPGFGITGTVAGQAVRVGSTRWIDPDPLAEPARALASAGMSVIVVEIDGHSAGVIGVRGELRPEAAETVAALHQQGMDTVMLTGDNAMTATVIAAQAGIDQIYSEQLPADKAGSRLAGGVNVERA